MDNFEERFKTAVDRFVTSEEGQATTEYVLIVSVAVTVGVAALKIFRPVLEQVQRGLVRKLERSLFPAGGGMHQNPFVRG